MDGFPRTTDQWSPNEELQPDVILFWLLDNFV